MRPAADGGPRAPSTAYGLLLGLGFGAFVDGIVLHQLLQWHHMVSHVQEYPPTTLAGMRANTLADGIFHAAAWVLAFAGSVATVVAWRQGRLAPSWSYHFGLVVAGFGVFNILDGIVNHWLLGVHHVRDDLGAPLAWDLGFLVVAVLLTVAGWLLYRHGSRDVVTAVQQETFVRGGR